MNNTTTSKTWTKKEFKMCESLRKRGHTYAEIAKKLNRGVSSIDHALRPSSRIRSLFFGDSSLEETPEAPKQKGATVTGNDEEIVAESVCKDIRTLEDLLTSCNVDLDKWQVENWRSNVWQVGAKTDDGRVVKQNLYQVKALLKRIPITREEIKEIFHSCSKPLVSKQLHRAKKSGKKLLEISIPDIHLGKLCWGEETGGVDYNTQEAINRFQGALESLISREDPKDIHEILLPIGNDFFNTDGKENETSNGTPQAEDSRWQKSFKKGCELATWAINRCSQVAPVKVIIIAGNHDLEKSYYLGCFLEAKFGEDKNVEINNSPQVRKYHQFGNTLIGFTHGDKIKLKDLTSLIQNEKRKEWGETKYCEFHLGHLHRESSIEDGGVTVRVIPSLCPPDSWHSQNGYVMSNPAAQAFLYDDEEGLECIYYHRVKA
jgi:hypothetical protein